MKFTIGCDPEVFVAKRGRLVSAIPYINGTKEKPVELPNGGMIQWDNVCAEFGTPPAHNENEWVKAVRDTVHLLHDRLDNSIRPVVLASANFPIEEVSSPEAKLFGCSPDLSAYTGMTNEPPSPEDFPTFRSCGGHIHIGFDDDPDTLFLLDHYDSMQFIKVLDLFLGVVSSVIDNSKDATERRKLYGRAGCFRKTSYGVEYRTLSNYWLKSPLYTRLVYSLVEDAIYHMSQNGPGIVKSIGESVIVKAVEDPHYATSLLGELISKWNIFSDKSKELISYALRTENNDNDLYSIWL